MSSRSTHRLSATMSFTLSNTEAATLSILLLQTVCSKYLYRETGQKRLPKSYSTGAARPMQSLRRLPRTLPRKPPKIERLHKAGQDIPINGPGCPGRVYRPLYSRPTLGRTEIAAMSVQSNDTPDPG